jgi:Single-stranded DNA-binding protein
MTMDVLKLTVIGRLACDPQAEEDSVKLSLVATYRWLDQEVRPATVEVYARGTLARICEKYLKQGSRVYCEARRDRGGYVADEIIMLAKGNPQPES